MPSEHAEAVHLYIYQEKISHITNYVILPSKYNRYVEGLDSKDAKVSLFKGKCSLNHLKLKPTVLHDFGLPARVRYVSLTS